MTLMCMKSNVLLPTICTFLCTFIAFNLQICLKASFEAMNYKVRGAPFFVSIEFVYIPPISYVCLNFLHFITLQNQI